LDADDADDADDDDDAKAFTITRLFFFKKQKSKKCVLYACLSGELVYSLRNKNNALELHILRKINCCLQYFRLQDQSLQSEPLICLLTLHAGLFLCDTLISKKICITLYFLPHFAEIEPNCHSLESQFRSQIKRNILFGLIWILTVSKGYTWVDKSDANIQIFNIYANIFPMLNVCLFCLFLLGLTFHPYISWESELHRQTTG